MSVYFFPILILAFLISHLFFGRSRKRKLERILLAESVKTIVTRKSEVNFKFSAIFLFGCFIVSACYTFAPKLYQYLSPIDSLNINGINYMGMFIIKIGFISHLVLGFQISDKLSLDVNTITVNKIMKMERLILFSVILLCAGVFIFISNVVSLLIFIAAFFFFLKQN